MCGVLAVQRRQRRGLSAHIVGSLRVDDGAVTPHTPGVVERLTEVSGGLPPVCCPLVNLDAAVTAVLTLLP